MKRKWPFPDVTVKKNPVTVTINLMAVTSR